MEDHIPKRPDRSLLLGRQTSKRSVWDVVLHENDSAIVLSRISLQMEFKNLMLPNSKMSLFYNDVFYVDGAFYFY